MPTCAFAPCDQVTECSLVGGCVNQRFIRPEQSVADADPVKTGARSLAGTKPARTNRDPAWIKRRRKAIAR